METTSFVSPKWVPQLSDCSQVYQAINKSDNVNYPVLVPNLKGLETALKVNVQEIAVFVAASETFSMYVYFIIAYLLTISIMEINSH